MISKSMISSGWPAGLAVAVARTVDWSGAINSRERSWIAPGSKGAPLEQVPPAVLPGVPGPQCPSVLGEHRVGVSSHEEEALASGEDLDFRHSVGRQDDCARPRPGPALIPYLTVRVASMPAARWLPTEQ